MVHGIVAACVADEAEYRADIEGLDSAQPATAGGEVGLSSTAPPCVS